MAHCYHHDVPAFDHNVDVPLKRAFDRGVFDKRLGEAPPSAAIMIKMNRRNFRFLPA